MKRSLIFFILLQCILLFGGCKKESVEGSYDNRSLGSSAKDILRSSRYSTLQIEIQYMTGYEPDDASVNNLLAFLNRRINKPGGIRVIKEPIPAGDTSSLSLSNIVSLERGWRSDFTSGDVISVYILITNSYYTETDILATAYWNTAFCLFGKAIDNNSGQIGQPTRTVLMSTLMEHEFGHLMGLVDLGSPMQTNHKDGKNGAHCINTDCLMYYNVEAGITGALQSVPPLDENCLADLKANGGK